MASTRALALAIGFGSLCGGALYQAVPENPGGVDLHPGPRARMALDRIQPTEAHVHGCVTRFGRPASHTTAQLMWSWPAADLDSTGCYDLAVPSDLLGLLHIQVNAGSDAPRTLTATAHHGDSVELGTLEVGTQLVRGVIRDRDGNRVAGVHVNGDGSTEYHATGDDGEYWVRIGAPGRYELHVARFESPFTNLAVDPIVVDIDAITDDPITRDITVR